jgi:hypothetical protein
MFCQNPGELFTMVACSVFLPRAGADLHLPHPTVYLNNIRKSRGKGGRLYLKDINGRVSVRLEIVLKRRMLRKICPGNLNAFNTIRAENIFKIVQFKLLDTAKIRLRYGKVFMKQLNGNIQFLKFSTMFFRSQIATDFELGIRHVLKFLDSLLGKNKYSSVHPFQIQFLTAIHGRHFV